MSEKLPTIDEALEDFRKACLGKNSGHGFEYTKWILTRIIAAEGLDAFGAGIRFGLNQLDDMMLGNINGQYPVEYVKNMISTVLKINEIPKPGIHDKLTNQANGETV